MDENEFRRVPLTLLKRNGLSRFVYQLADNFCRWLDLSDEPDALACEQIHRFDVTSCIDIWRGIP